MKMKQALKKWEGSKADNKMDKRMGLKEGSPKDNDNDKKMARKMMHRNSMKSVAQKTFGGKY